MDTQNLNRKQRRALQFGTDEQRAEVIAQAEAKAGPRVVIEQDGVIVIPHPENGRWLMENALRWMIPYRDLDEKYKAFQLRSDEREGSSLEVYGQFIADWFYRGVKDPVFEFKPNVRLPGTLSPKEPKRGIFISYLMFLLGSRESAHEHKFAYCIYVLDMCVTKVSWSVIQR